jgi:hypothetical protein
MRTGALVLGFAGALLALALGVLGFALGDLGIAAGARSARLLLGGVLGFLGVKERPR